MYELSEDPIAVDDFMRLRARTGLTPRPRAAALKGLPGSLFTVQVRYHGETIGMGRVVGDGGMNFLITDVAVDPKHQGNGQGRRIMESIMAYLHRTAQAGANVSLIADVPDLYAKFGFQLSRPACEGMQRIM